MERGATDAQIYNPKSARDGKHGFVASGNRRGSWGLSN
jgi:hypothetical protein